MNTISKLASVPIVLLLTLGVFIGLPVAQAQSPFAPVPVIGAAGNDCMGSTAETVDPLYNAVCAILDGAGGALIAPGDVDADEDGRPDYAELTLPAGVVAPNCNNLDDEPDPDFCSFPFPIDPLFSGIGKCPDGTTAVGDRDTVNPGEPFFFGDVVCVGSATFFVQMDYFFSDDTPTTEPGERSADFDYRVDPFLYNPQDGSRIDQLFGDTELRFTNMHASATGADYDLAFVRVDHVEANGGFTRTACIMCVSTANLRIAFGAFDGYLLGLTQDDDPATTDVKENQDYNNPLYNDEGVIDVDQGATDHSIGSTALPASVLLLDLPAILEAELPPQYADENGFLVDIFHFKGPGNTDIDDDGFAFVDEFNCQSNPTNKKSTCSDLDGDGLANSAEVDYANDEPGTDHRNDGGRTGDGKSNSYDPDTDGDGIKDGAEAPGRLLIPDQDTDADGLADEIDNCPSDANANQNNVDGDLLGDLCDSDADGDGTTNAADGCDVDGNGGAPFNMWRNKDEKADNDCDTATDLLANPADTLKGGDIGDTDDDNDRVSDVDELAGTQNKFCAVPASGVSQKVAGSAPACTGAPTNKNKADTDGDKLDDKLEMVTGFGLLCKFNAASPFAAGDYSKCKDGVQKVFTDPNNADTDKDELNDELEVKATYDWKRGNIPAILATIPATPAGTPATPIPNPLLDANGKFNGIQITHPPSTDPTVADTDGDELTDGQEIAPTRASGLPPPAPATVPDPTRFQTDPTDAEDPLQSPTGALGGGVPGIPNVGGGALPADDTQDIRDLDRDGDTTEPSGQSDTLERSFFYYDQDSAHSYVKAETANLANVHTKDTGFEGTGGLTLYVLQSPSLNPSLQTKQPVLTVRFGDVFGTKTVKELVVIEDKRGAAPVTYCIVQGDGNSVFYYAGAQKFNQTGSAHPCGEGQTVWGTFRVPGVATFNGLNGVLKTADPWYSSLVTNSGTAQWITVVDADKDNVPDGVIVTPPANAPCSPYPLPAQVPVPRCIPGAPVPIDLQLLDDSVKSVTDALGGSNVEPPSPPEGCNPASPLTCSPVQPPSGGGPPGVPVCAPGSIVCFNPAGKGVVSKAAFGGGAIQIKVGPVTVNL